MVTEKMIEAAKAVIAQWDTPNWKIANPTSKFMDALRLAVDEAEKAILEPAWWVVTTDMGKVIFHGSDKDRADRVAAIHGRDAQALYTSPPALSTDAEPVAWLTEGQGWERVFIHKEAAEIMALEEGKITPLYRRLISEDALKPVGKVDASYGAEGMLVACYTPNSLPVGTKLYAATEYALSAQVQDVAGWQDISTAPKDGSEILLYREDCGVILGRWISCSDFVVDGDPSAEFCQSDEEWEEPDWFGADFVSGFRITNDGLPTHWMPLPAAPAAKLEEKP